MGSLSLLPLSLSASFRPHLSPSKTQLSNSVFCPHFSSTTLKSVRLPSKTIAFGSNASEPGESRFLDENGVVDDMDGYLNYLSLEYDTVWDTKPSWVQNSSDPWHFWMIMLKNVSKIITGKNFPCFGEGCMNQPLVYHNYSRLVSSGDQIASLMGGFYGTFDLDVDLCEDATEGFNGGYHYGSRGIIRKAYSEMIAERRKRVTNGVEDTFGLGNDIN